MDTTTKLKVGFAALMILSGIGVASYPVISTAVAQRPASEAIQNSDDTEKSMDTEKLYAAKEAARRYNQQLDSAVERDAAGEAEDTGTSYVDLVDVGESLGYITIPKIDVNLPIYEGTSDDVLQRGVGHLEGSSYPLGGESTHSVLTGHRGLPGAVLVTDLDKLGVLVKRHAGKAGTITKKEPGSNHWHVMVRAGGLQLFAEDQIERVAV